MPFVLHFLSNRPSVSQTLVSDDRVMVGVDLTIGRSTANCRLNNYSKDHTYTPYTYYIVQGKAYIQYSSNEQQTRTVPQDQKKVNE